MAFAAADTYDRAAMQAAAAPLPASHHAVSRIAMALRVGLAIWSAIYVLMYLGIALARLRYPFELEWMEGATVDHLRRCVAGEPLYVAPSLEFVPFVYTPLFYYVGALIARFTGTGFVALRSLSLLASLGCFACIGGTVWRQSSSRWSAWMAVGFFAATFRASGAWLDLARVDSLFLFFLLTAICSLGGHRRPAMIILSAGLLALAFFTKQATAVACLPLLLVLWLDSWRAVSLFVFTLLGLVAAVSFWLNSASAGWFAYYVFILPRRHQINLTELSGFWLNDVLWLLAPALSIMVVYLFRQIRSPHWRTCVLPGAVSAGGLLSAWLGRLHSGGYDNVLLPAYATLAVLFGAALAALEAERPRHDRRTIFVYLLCAAQLAWLVYDPRAQIPGAADLRTGQDLIRRIAALPGEVLMPSHGYLPALAGKRTSAYEMAIYDVLRADDGPASRHLRQEISEAIRSRRFAAIVLDTPTYEFDLDVRDGYGPPRRLLSAADGFWPVTGLRTRPELLYLPRPGRLAK